MPIHVSSGLYLAEVQGVGKIFGSARSGTSKELGVKVLRVALGEDAWKAGDPDFCFDPTW